MKKICTTQEQLEQALQDIGFTLSDGKFYWGDTSQGVYVTAATASTGSCYFKYTDSAGTEHSIATQTSQPYCIIEYFNLINGGIALRVAFALDSTITVGVPLQFAAVAKEDGSGFNYLFVVSALVKLDDLGGIITTAGAASGNNITDTSSLVIMMKIYNNRNAFADIHARSLVATQNLGTTVLYTFVCGGKKYLVGMYGSSATVKYGQIAFEIQP